MGRPFYFMDFSFAQASRPQMQFVTDFLLCSDCSPDYHFQLISFCEFKACPNPLTLDYIVQLVLGFLYSADNTPREGWLVAL